MARGEVGDVVGLEQEAVLAVADEVGEDAAAGGEHGCADGEGLEDDAGEDLEPSGRDQQRRSGRRMAATSRRRRSARRTRRRRGRRPGAGTRRAARRRRRGAAVASSRRPRHASMSEVDALLVAHPADEDEARPLGAPADGRSLARCSASRPSARSASRRRGTRPCADALGKMSRSRCRVQVPSRPWTTSDSGERHASRRATRGSTRGARPGSGRCPTQSRQTRLSRRRLVDDGQIGRKLWNVCTVATPRAAAAPDRGRREQRERVVEVDDVGLRRVDGVADDPLPHRDQTTPSGHRGATRQRPRARCRRSRRSTARPSTPASLEEPRLLLDDRVLAARLGGAVAVVDDEDPHAAGGEPTSRSCAG